MKNSRSLVVVALVIAFALSGPGTADAQQASAASQEQELDLQTTEFIFVEGSLPFVPTSNTILAKLPLSLERTPANVGVVTRALFEEQDGQVLGDALENVSGLNVQPGFGVSDYFIIRGFDSLSSSLILTDGAPEPETSYYQLYNVELVEVLKGPGGFLYGSNPLAGTVNLVRKQPLANRRIGVNAALGSYSRVEGSLDYNYGRPGGDFAFRLNALFRDTDAYRTNKGSRAAAINPALSWRIDDRNSLVANFEYAGSNFAPEAGIPLLFDEVPAIDRRNDYNSQFDRSDQNITRFQVDYQGELSDQVTLRNKLYYRQLDWLSDGTLLNLAFPVFGANGPTGAVEVYRTFIALDDSQKFLGNQLEAIIEADTGSIRHNILAGVEVGRFTDAFTLDIGLLAPVDLFAPNNPPFPPQPIPGQAIAGDARTTVIAPYVIDQVTVSDTFQVLAGVRLDLVDFNDDLTRRQRDDTKASPMLGVVWLPRPDLSIYGNYSRSFSPPSPRTFSSLIPEESRQVELGMKLQFLDRRARVTAAVYEIERDNIAIADDNGFTQQTGNQRSRGFEVEFAAEPGHGFRTALSYAYNDSILTEFARLEQTFVGPMVFNLSGNRAAFAPEHLLNLWVSKSFANGVGVGLGARYVGDQFIDENNGFTLSESFVLAGAAHYGWARYRVSFNVENLADATYYQRGFGAQSVTPAGPTAAYVRFGYSF